MRVTPNGEYDYRVIDTLGINVSPTHIVQQDDWELGEHENIDNLYLKGD